MSVCSCEGRDARGCLVQLAVAIVLRGRTCRGPSNCKAEVVHRRGRLGNTSKGHHPLRRRASDLAPLSTPASRPGSVASRRRAGRTQMARPGLGARQGPHPVQDLLVEAGGALVMLPEVLVPGGHFEDLVQLRRVRRVLVRAPAARTGAEAGAGQPLDCPHLRHGPRDRRRLTPLRPRQRRRLPSETNR